MTSQPTKKPYQVSTGFEPIQVQRPPYYEEPYYTEDGVKYPYSTSSSSGVKSPLRARSPVNRSSSTMDYEEEKSRHNLDSLRDPPRNPSSVPIQASPSSGHPQAGSTSTSSNSMISPQERTEMLDFMKSGLGTMKALMININQKEQKLAKYKEQRTLKKVPDFLSLKDISSQVPASQPGIREQLRKQKELNELETFDQIIQAQVNEHDRMLKDLKDSQSNLINDYIDYTNVVESTSKLGLSVSNCLPIIQELRSKFNHTLNQEIIRITMDIRRSITIKHKKHKEQALKEAKEKEERANKPELTLQEMVDAQVRAQVQAALKGLNPSSSKKKPSSSGKKGSSKGRKRSKSSGKKQIKFEPDESRSRSRPRAATPHQPKNGKRRPSNKKADAGTKQREKTESKGKSGNKGRSRSNSSKRN